MSDHEPFEATTDPEERADGSSLREHDPGEPELADGSNYRRDEHPLEDDRTDPDGVVEASQEHASE
jgi:hypothetical protein